MIKGKKTVVPAETVRLSPSQLKALKLLRGTDYSLKRVAELSNIHYDEMCDLYAGLPPSDPVVQLFGSELKKIDKNKADKIKRITRENKLIVMEEINEFLLANRRDGVRDEDTLVSVLNALSKASVGIEINQNIQNNIFAGMTPQELVHEYKRLTALAASSEA